MSKTPRGSKCLGSCVRAKTDSCKEHAMSEMRRSVGMEPWPASIRQTTPVLIENVLKTHVDIDGIRLQQVPVFLVDAFTVLMANDGYKMEGIFRKGGNEARIKTVWYPFHGYIGLPEVLTPIDVACLIKKFFRVLATPVFLNRNYQIKHPETRLKALLELVSVLPASHRDTLAHLCLSLRAIAAEPANKMDVEALCICLVASLFRDVDAPAPSLARDRVESMKADYDDQAAILAILIRNADRLPVGAARASPYDGLLPEDTPGSPLFRQLHGLSVDTEPATPDALNQTVPGELTSTERKRLHEMRDAGLSKSGRKLVKLAHTSSSCIVVTDANGVDYRERRNSSPAKVNSPTKSILKSRRHSEKSEGEVATDGKSGGFGASAVRKIDSVSRRLVQGIAKVGRRISQPHPPPVQAPPVQAPAPLATAPAPAPAPPKADNDANPQGKLNFDEDEEAAEVPAGVVVQEEKAPTPPLRRRRTTRRGRHPTDPTGSARRESSLSRGKPNTLENGLPMPVLELIRGAERSRSAELLSPVVEKGTSLVPSPVLNAAPPNTPVYVENLNDSGLEARASEEAPTTPELGEASFAILKHTAAVARDRRRKRGVDTNETAGEEEEGSAEGEDAKCEPPKEKKASMTLETPDSASSSDSSPHEDVEKENSVSETFETCNDSDMMEVDEEPAEVFGEPEDVFEDAVDPDFSEAHKDAILQQTTPEDVRSSSSLIAAFDVRPSIAMIKKTRAGAVSSAVKTFNQRTADAVAAEADTPVRKRPPPRRRSPAPTKPASPYTFRKPQLPDRHYMAPTTSSAQKNRPAPKRLQSATRVRSPSGPAAVGARRKLPASPKPKAADLKKSFETTV